MGMSRRQTLQSMLVAAGFGVWLHDRRTGMAQDVATPAGTPVGDDPDGLLDRLLTTTVDTPLFPRDSGEIRPLHWTDEGDTDLIGTVGGVLMQTGKDQNGNFVGPGVYLVYPDADAALGRLSTARDDGEDFGDADLTAIELAGYSGITISDSEGTRTIIVVGPVIVSALADRRQPVDPALRSLVNCLALLDHVQSVL